MKNKLTLSIDGDDIILKILITRNFELSNRHFCNCLCFLRYRAKHDSIVRYCYENVVCTFVRLSVCNVGGF